MLSRTITVLALLLFLVCPMRSAAQDPVPLYPANYRVLQENDRVRVLDFRLKKGAKESFHAHPAAVTYVLSPFTIRFSFPDGRTTVRKAKAGDVFLGESLIHASENIGDTDAHGILIELKVSPKAKTDAPSSADILTAVTFIRGIAGKQEELKKELLALSAPTRAEAGNITYDLYQSPLNTNQFMRFEVWRSPADLEAHKQTPHLKASFEHRQKEGWTTEITLWKRVVDQ